MGEHCNCFQKMFPPSELFFPKFVRIIKQTSFWCVICNTLCRDFCVACCQAMWSGGNMAWKSWWKGVEKAFCFRISMTFSFPCCSFSVLVSGGCALSNEAVNSVPLNSTHDCMVSHCFQLSWQINIFTSTMSTFLCVGSAYIGLLSLCEMRLGFGAIAFRL